MTNCRTSAQHAVASILAPDTVGDYDYLPFFYSRVFNLSWQARDHGRCGYAGVFCSNGRHVAYMLFGLFCSVLTCGVCPAVLRRE